MLLHGDDTIVSASVRLGGVVEVDDKGASGRRLQGDFAEGGGEGGEQLLGELYVLDESLSERGCEWKTIDQQVREGRRANDFRWSEMK